jgi:ubiquitin related modifier 1
MPLELDIEFSGGAELLFNKVKHHKVTLPDRENNIPWTVRDLIKWISDNLLVERPELFIMRDSVRPGIIVMINLTDWALMGELDYQLSNGDHILFISTLHGG